MNPAGLTGSRILANTNLKYTKAKYNAIIFSQILIL